MNKKQLPYIAVPLLIVLILIILIIFQEQSVFVLVFSGVVLLVMFNIYFQRFFYQDKNEIIKRLESKLKETQAVVEAKTQAEQRVVHDMPVAILMFDDSYVIKWANEFAKDIFENILVNRKLEMISKELFLALTEKDDFIVRIYTKEFQITQDKEHNIVYLHDVTLREELKRKYDQSTDAIAVLNLDNLDDAMSVLDVSQRSYLQGRYLEALESWGTEYGLYVAPITNSKLICAMNKKELTILIHENFSIVDKIAAISKENDLLVTLSMGIACGNLALNKLGDKAQEALDLSLSRGGDQVVVDMDGNDLMFFGGNTNTAEKRTRITSRINTQKLEKLIIDQNRVFIIPHAHPDTDALGAAIGLLKIAQSFDKECYIIIDQNNVDKTVDKIIQMIEYEYITLLDYFIAPNQALDLVERDDIVIIADHHSIGQTLDERFITLSDHIVIVDHHRKLSDAIEGSKISHIEPYASSSVELITEMIDLCTNDIELNQFEATVMLSGIMVDTNNFMYRTGSRTFEASAFLRRFGADTFKVKIILREGLDEIQLKSQLLSLAKVVHQKFSIVLVPDHIDTTRNLLAKMADVLLEIDDTIAAFAIGELDNETIGISARSLEGFNVQVIMEDFSGGGHLNNAGAQLKNTTMEEVQKQLIDRLNEAIQEEKPMKVILIKDLRGKGKKGDIIDVATGYGNFLLTNKTAIEATQENLQGIEAEKQKKKEAEKKELQHMKQLKTKLEEHPVKVYVKIGENGKLYGKINSKQIADAYEEQHGIDLDKRKIQLKQKIASLGTFKIPVKLHRKVKAEIEVLVIEE